MDSEKKESFGGEEEEVVDVNNLMFDIDRRGGNSDGVVVPLSTTIWGDSPDFPNLKR